MLSFSNKQAFSFEDSGFSAYFQTLLPPLINAWPPRSVDCFGADSDRLNCLSQKILTPDPGTHLNSSCKSPTEMQLQIGFDMRLKAMTLNYSKVSDLINFSCQKLIVLPRHHLKHSPQHLLYTMQGPWTKNY